MRLPSRKVRSEDTFVIAADARIQLQHGVKHANIDVERDKPAKSPHAQE
jgi:hypothetical protein